MAKADVVLFEACDNFEKQTYRNRAYIYGTNGKLPLSVPVVYSQKNRQQYKNVIIANTYNWQNQHLKSIESAYRKSPFFEFYIDELLPLFHTPFEKLFDFNLKCFEVLCESLQLDIEPKFTTSFEKHPEKTEDFRSLVQVSTSIEPLETYTQVFTEKHGFLNNLSILDLLFNEGPNTLNYLQAQNQ